MSLHNWDQAVKSFEAVLMINPNHGEARKQLQIAQKELEKFMQNRIIQKYFGEGLKEFGKQDWIKAIIAFEKVLSLQPNHQPAKENLKKAQTRLENAGTNSAKKHYYEQALLAINEEDWVLAEALFNKINNLDQNYKDVPTQLKLVKSKLTELADLLALYLFRELAERNPGLQRSSNQKSGF
jgi:tetratricopeptide (TPR) repeat protein